MAYSFTFWGVRGSIACPTPRHVGYGGNTSCIEVGAGDRMIILDAGTGLRELGNKLLKDGVKRADLLLTHTHWDHINGFPFFSPAFSQDFELEIRGGHLKGRGGIRAALEGQMTQPMFPVPLEQLHADMVFHDFEAGESFQLGDDILVKTAPLNHPNGATGYRIEHAGKAMCYVTDTEHIPGTLDQNILDLIAGADIVIYDSTYTDDEFPSHVGWGHSTWQEGVRLCRQAGAKRLAIFHHDPDHEDDFMAKVEEEAKATWDGAIVAREGMTIVLD
ncbi:MAG: MBL fold metallo-hydrolase [Deltaproteobacteria bacterium]|nr:MBL fold metallo-hydrolase [Deltaproteobacteria bacterium]